MNIENGQFIKQVLQTSYDRVYTASRSILRRIGDEIELCKDAIKPKKSKAQWPEAFINKFSSGMNEEVKIINDTCFRLRTEVKTIINSARLRKIRAALATKEEFFESGQYIETYFDEDTKKLIQYTENNITDETIGQMYHIWQYYLVRYKEFVMEHAITKPDQLVYYRYKSLICLERSLVSFTKSFMKVTRMFKNDASILKVYHIRLVKGLHQNMIMPDGKMHMEGSSDELVKIEYRKLEDIQPM